MTNLFEQAYDHWLAEQRQQQLYRALPPTQPLCALNLGSNDYLGLAEHPALKAAAKDCSDRFGVGATASRLLTHLPQLYEALERDLAMLKKTEAALVMNSGYQANATVLAALLDPAVLKKQPVVLADRLIHASLYTACRNAQVRPQRFRHNDLEHLERLLRLTASPHKAIVVLVESVYGMDGDLADLAGLIALCQQFGAFLYVDEAHATGVFGANGGGLSSLYPGQIDLVMGTFGKALGGFGAYVAGKRGLIDYLINRCSGFVYSTALPPAVVAAANAAVQLLPSMDHQRRHLLELAGVLRDGLAARGYQTGASTSQIVPLILGGAGQALALQQHLCKAGIVAPAIRPPTVPPNRARLRLSLTANHRPQDLDRFWQALDGWQG